MKDSLTLGLPIDRIPFIVRFIEAETGRSVERSEGPRCMETPLVHHSPA